MITSTPIYDPLRIIIIILKKKEKKLEAKIDRFGRVIPFLERKLSRNDESKLVLAQVIFAFSRREGHANGGICVTGLLVSTSDKRCSSSMGEKPVLHYCSNHERNNPLIIILPDARKFRETKREATFMRRLGRTKIIYRYALHAF